jgi:hypothetical protein
MFDIGKKFKSWRDWEKGRELDKGVRPASEGE